VTGRGPLVFRLELPLRLAPTLNAYAATKRHKWQMANLNREVDQLIMIAKAAWPSWRMDDLAVRHQHQIVTGKLRTKERRTGGRRRLVLVTRYSSREPDEVSADVCGGKLPLDRLKHAEIIVDDNRKWLAREAHWCKAPPSKGRVVISVYELEQQRAR
jgi:hypothetical protein